MAHACRALGDGPGQIAALDRLLAAEPRNVRALIMKADHLAAHGDARSATAYYLDGAQIRAASEPDCRPTLRRSCSALVRRCERYAAEFQDYILSRLTAKGFDAARSSRRFAESLDIVLGKKQHLPAGAKYYYFPGLPQIQFYERDAFPWLAELESCDRRHPR